MNDTNGAAQPAMVLTDDQRRALIDALKRTFLFSDRLLVELSDTEDWLPDSIPMSGDLSTVATLVVQRAIGTGQVARLLGNALAAARQSPPLRTLAVQLGIQTDDRAAAADGLVETIEAGFEALARNTDQPEVRAALRNAAEPLVLADDGIVRLARYKALHDALHGIPYRLPTIAAAIEELQKGGEAAGAARTELTAYGRDMRRLASQASQDAAGLPDLDRVREQEWINELEDLGVQLGKAAATSAPQLARAALEGIGSLQQQQAPFINSLLAEVASTLPLRGLATAFELLVPAMHRLRLPGTALGLQKARFYILQLSPLFTSVVDAHKRWQRIDLHLTLEENSRRDGLPVRPAARERLIEQLRGLVARDAKADWAVSVTTDLDAWKEAELVENRQDADKAFALLRTVCRDRFFGVDKMLHEMCGQLTQITTPLGKLRELAEA